MFKNDLWKEIKDTIITVIIASISAMLVTTFVAANAEVPSASMEPTLEVNSRLILDKLSYRFTEPKRGDIITFYAPDLVDTLYIKRIIALGGETVEGIDGHVYINGEQLKEDYVAEKLSSDFGPYTVPEGGYFVMGDNRNYSLDARYWENTYIYNKDIVGKAFFKYKPKFEIFKNITY